MSAYDLLQAFMHQTDTNQGEDVVDSTILDDPPPVEHEGNDTMLVNAAKSVSSRSWHRVTLDVLCPNHLPDLPMQLSIVSPNIIPPIV